MKSTVITCLAFTILLASPRASAQAPKASGFFYYQGNITAKILKFRDQLSGATAYSQKIQWKPITLELPLDNTEELNKGLKLYEEGTVLGKDGKLEEGFAKYKAALELLDKHMYTLTVSQKFPDNKKKYRGLFKRMAKFAFYLGDKETAKQYILRYLYFRYGDKAKKWPKDMRDLWTSVADPYFASGKAKLTITTDPPGARIYYKFSDKGPAPLSKKVPGGEVLILATHPGYKPSVKRVMLDPTKGDVVTKITLEPMLNSPLKYLLPAKLELGHMAPGANIVTTTTTLGVDVMIFYYLQAKSETEVKVTAFLFDPRVKKKLNEISKTFSALSATPDSLKHFVATLFKGVRLDGKLDVPKPKSSFFKDFMEGVSSLPEKKYFWPTVGGIGGAILIGTATAVYLLTQKETIRPYGSRVLMFR